MFNRELQLAYARSLSKEYDNMEADIVSESDEDNDWVQEVQEDDDDDDMNVEEKQLVVKKRSYLASELSTFQSEFFDECKKRKYYHSAQSHNANTLAVGVFTDFHTHLYPYTTISTWIGLMACTCKDLSTKFKSIDPVLYKEIVISNPLVLNALFDVSLYTASVSHKAIRGNVTTLHLDFLYNTLSLNYITNQVSDTDKKKKKKEDAHGYYTYNGVVMQWFGRKLPPKLTLVVVNVQSSIWLKWLLSTGFFTVNVVSTKINFLLTDVNTYLIGDHDQLRSKWKQAFYSVYNGHLFSSAFEYIDKSFGATHAFSG